jgi:hypothetical protein
VVWSGDRLAVGATTSAPAQTGASIRALMFEGAWGRAILPVGMTGRAQQAPRVASGGGELGVAKGQYRDGEQGRKEGDVFLLSSFRRFRYAACSGALRAQSAPSSVGVPLGTAIPHQHNILWNC